jgi:uncharacterized protein YuzE
MTVPVETTYDRKTDVLYVKLHGARPYASREHPLDGDLVVDYDHERRAIGIRFLHVQAVRGMWDVHPARHCLPREIRDEIERFMSWLDAGPEDPERCAQRNVPPKWLVEATA